MRPFLVCLVWAALTAPASAKPVEPPWFSQEFEVGCGQLLAVADEYLVSRRLTTEINHANRARYYGTGINNGHGFPLLNTFFALRHYADFPPRAVVPKYAAWIAYSDFELLGNLRLTATPTGCELALTHTYLARNLVWMTILPVMDGRPILGSNGKLEREYLAGIQRRLRLR